MRLICYRPEIPEGQYRWYLWASCPTYNWYYIKDVDHNFVNEKVPYVEIQGASMIEMTGNRITFHDYQNQTKMRFERII